MQVLEFNVGDKVWFYHDNHQGRMSSGNVVMKTKLPGYGETWYYIIEIPTSIDPLLIVRDGWSMSDSENQDIGFFRNRTVAKDKNKS